MMRLATTSDRSCPALLLAPARGFYVIGLLLIGLCVSTSKSAGAPQSSEDISKIIRAFAEKELKFKVAWLNYTYTQNLEMKVISVNGRPARESYLLESEIVFDDQGRRKIRVLNRVNRLRRIQFTPEDEEVVHNLQPFVLTAEDLPDYEVKYQRKEKIDEIDCYVFSVEPRSMRKNRFYFKGTIWVDDKDLQIVMSRGKTVPEPRGQKFPEFETRRELIDKQFWFPTWTEARDVLRFKGGDDIEIHEIVTYDNYKRFQVDAKIKYGTEKPPN